MSGKRRKNVLGALLLAALGAFWTRPAAGALPTPVKLDDPWYPSSHDYYQLRDVSGTRDGHTIAGSQWFSTVIGRRNNNVYRRDTYGGQAPDVTMVTSADLVSDFSSVYLRGGVSFDPVESVALVIKEGRGTLSLDFGNDYHSSLGAEDAMEDVRVAIPEDEYTARVTPGQPAPVASADRLHTEMSFNAQSPQSYGSSLGYLTFRQSASTDAGAAGFRESIQIPLVVANVYDGPASDAGNELLFDIAVFGSIVSAASGDTAGGEPASGDVGSGDMEVVTRKKFRWGAGTDMTQDLGTFFFIQRPEAPMPVYRLQNRVTNRTGTRYRQQRYDAGGTGYQNIIPDYWLYDIDPDLYGTLPQWFYLDAQSQIAPGLVTQYSASMDMAYTSSESFRLYPFQAPQTPRDLRLTFRSVGRNGGMTPYGTPVNGRPVRETRETIPWTATAFRMTFADVAENGENTVREISNDVGGRPVMPDPAAYAFTGAADAYIKADALNAFELNAIVPEGLVASPDAVSPDIVSSGDVSLNNVALLPVHVRLRVSRKESPIAGRWDALENAASVIDEFARTLAIWVRSPNAAEADVNLFTALSDRGYGVSRCVQAFTHEDFLYIDFIVLAADAKSPKAGKTALCDVVEDDGIPYILIGDGKADGAWTLSFFIDAAGDAPNVDPDTPVTPGAGGDSVGGGGGGCSAGLLPFVFVLPVLFCFVKFRDSQGPKALEPPEGGFGF